jgi:hypothetical protein|tara:strand:- start:343 stop:759 length:417 start_codon:yes stop_codon:yes gene_type:complete
MKKSTVKVNTPISKKMKKIDDLIEEGVKERLHSIARTATNLSPVDTGAYVTSFSFAVGAGRPRGKSSEGRPKKQDKVAMRAKGLSNLNSDIAKITDFSTKDTIVLRNGSPHAKDVEAGGPRWRRTAYKVFGQIKDIYK